MQHKKKSVQHSGITMIFVFVFGTSIALMVASLMQLTLIQLRAVDIKVRRERALGIAEAGMEYYKWFLAHFPTDVRNGTGVSGPYVIPYLNASGVQEGTYTLTVTGNYQCSELTSVDVQSTGVLTGFPTQTRTVSARYMPPSVAEFSSLTNAALWMGPASNNTGPLQSNTGIRMDGAHSSLLQAGAGTWSCTNPYGCSSTSTQNGVFGTTGNTSLWRYPVATVPFPSLTNLATMKTRAQTGGGLYFGPLTGALTARGYHVIFNAGGTMSVYTVSATTGYASRDQQGVDGTDYHGITTEALLGTYTAPAACAVVFFEDRVWVEGVVKNKVTLVAADLTTTPNYDPDIIIQNNLTRAATLGADGITLIAEKSIKISAVAPTTLTMEGIFVGFSGSVGRNYYNPNTIATSLRTSLTRVGSTVAFSDGSFAWSSFGTVLSGYTTRTVGYDRTQFFNPPPFTPVVYATPRYVRWREE
jgi:hypothetical protein